MPGIRIAIARIRALFRRDATTDEIREELHFHVQMRTEEYEREGLDARAAHQAALRRFGNLAVIQDRGYDERGGGVMETMLQDVKYALRQLGRQPSFAILAGLTLALGIGVSTALFSVIDAALLRPLPIRIPNSSSHWTWKKPAVTAKAGVLRRPWWTFESGGHSAGSSRTPGWAASAAVPPAHRRHGHTRASDRRRGIGRFSRDIRHHADSWSSDSGRRHEQRRAGGRAARARLLAAAVRRRSERARTGDTHPGPPGDDRRRAARGFLH